MTRRALPASSSRSTATSSSVGPYPGGCLARGHPPSLTGLYGLLECAEQVTGKAGDRQVDHARLALSTCEGGNYNLALAHIIERAER